MTISFACPGCKKPYQVADELAGRKTKCPACKTGLVVPAPKNKPAPPPPMELVGAEVVEDEVEQKAPPPAAKKKPKPVVHRQEPEVVEEVAEDVEVVKDVEVVDEERPRSKKKRRPPEPEDDEDVVEVIEDEDQEEGERPRRRKKFRGKKKSNAKVILVAAGGGVLLLALVATAGFFAWRYLLADGLPAEAKYLPDDLESYSQVNWEAMRGSQVFQSLPGAMVAPMQQMETALGTPSSNIARLISGKSYLGDELTVVKTKTAVTGAGVLGVRANPGQYKEVKVGRFTMYQGPFDAFCVPEDTIIVRGPTDVLKAVLDRNKRPALREGLKKMLKRAKLSHTVLIVADTSEAQAKAAFSSELSKSGLPVGQQLDQVTNSVQSVVVEADVTTDVSLNATLVCKDGAGAESTRQTIEKGLADAKQQMPSMAMFAPAVVQQMTQMIESIKASSAGSEVNVSARFDPRPLLDAFKGIAMPGGADPVPGQPPGRMPPGIPPGMPRRGPLNRGTGR